MSPDEKTPANMPSNAATSIVTGANSGIGLEVTAGLRNSGHHVVMACRSMQRCSAAKAYLDARDLPGSCECRQLDLDDFASIRRFATELRQAGPTPVACLVNNAGVMGVSPRADGSCGHWRPNHLGPYLLTRLLMPLMAPHSRIVTVASEAHRRGGLCIARDPQGGELQLVDGSAPSSALRALLGSSWYLQYARSKLANVLMTAELSRRLQQRHSSVTACSVSPGWVNTRIFANVPGPLRGPLELVAGWTFQTSAQGARTALHAALSPDLEGRHQLYLHDSRPCRASAAAQDPGLAADLWQLSNQQVGLSPAEDAALWPRH